MDDQLESLYQNIDKVSLKYKIPAAMLANFKNLYHDYKIHLAEPKTNGHYISCPWADPRNTYGPDTCPCSRMAFEASNIAEDLVADIGLTLINNIISEMNTISRNCCSYSE